MSRDLPLRFLIALLLLSVVSMIGASAASGAESSKSASFNAPKTPVGVCFTGGTLVAAEEGKVAIETLEVGDRVTTTHQAEQSSSTEVDPATWRKITLQMPNPEFPSDILDIEVLRSGEWMEAFGCQEGATIDFALEEMGLQGNALVTKVEACPEIAEGEGRVVLATVTHFNGNVHRIKLANGETIEPTGRHQLFSATREAWVPTSFLEVGESLKTRSGDVLIEEIHKVAGVHRVYNIEVETEHCYFVSKTEVLSHNINPCAQPVKPSLTAHKEALAKVHEKVGKLPKGEPGKFGAPQAGTPKKGYRLDPPHPNAKPGSPETGYHFNFWDYTGGKRGSGGVSGAIPIE